MSSFVSVSVVPEKASQMWVSFSVRWDENSLQKEELGYETDLKWCGEISHSAVWNTSVNCDFANPAVKGMENFLVFPKR